MRVFLSWSGEASRKAAVALRDWLPLVVQAVEPYMSAEDLEKGVRWSTEIGSELDSCNFGIICLTRENLEAPWIQFEAGALSKSMETARVSPLLIGLKSSEVRGPLVQFQAASPDRDDMLRLVNAINAGCGDQGLQKDRLEKVFRALWPQLHTELEAAIELAEKGTPTSPKRAVSDMLEELLELSRNQTRLLTRVEPEFSPIPQRISEQEMEALRVQSIRRYLARRILGLDGRPEVTMRGSGSKFVIVLRGSIADVEQERMTELLARPEFQGVEVIVRRKPPS